MNESQAVILVLNTLESYLQSLSKSIPIRTSGQNDDVQVPGIVLEEWDADRLRNRNGARNFAAPTVDADTGYEDGKEEHIFYDFTADLVVRHTDELSRDDLLRDIRHAFLSYEDDPKSLHADVSEVNVGDPTPRALVFREPDWYQGGVEISFVYVERLTKSGDTLQTVNQSVTVEGLQSSGADEDDTRIGRNL